MKSLLVQYQETDNLTGFDREIQKLHILRLVINNRKDNDYTPEEQSFFFVVASSIPSVVSHSIALSMLTKLVEVSSVLENQSLQLCVINAIRRFLVRKFIGEESRAFCRLLTTLIDFSMTSPKINEPSADTIAEWQELADNTVQRRIAEQQQQQ
jgi:hypothetical protein